MYSFTDLPSFVLFPLLDILKLGLLLVLILLLLLLSFLCVCNPLVEVGAGQLDQLLVILIVSPQAEDIGSTHVKEGADPRLKLSILSSSRIIRQGIMIILADVLPFNVGDLADCVPEFCESAIPFSNVNSGTVVQCHRSLFSVHVDAEVIMEIEGAKQDKVFVRGDHIFKFQADIHCRILLLWRGAYILLRVESSEIPFSQTLPSTSSGSCLNNLVHVCIAQTFSQSLHGDRFFWKALLVYPLNHVSFKVCICDLVCLLGLI